MTDLVICFVLRAQTLSDERRTPAHVCALEGCRAHKGELRRNREVATQTLPSVLLTS